MPNDHINIARQAVDSTVETLYTVPAATTTAVKDMHICNNSALDCYVSLWLVPNAASPTDENVMFYEWNVPANDFVHWSGWQLLDVVGDTIQALSETTDQLTITITGVEITT
jgi:hypothetical protein